MRRLLARLLLAGFLAAAPVSTEAAWGHVGVLGTATSISSSRSLTVTTSSAAEAGNVIVLVVGKDNTNSGSDGDYFECESVTDPQGWNIWVKLVEWTNTQTGAGTGTTVCIWMTRVTHGIPSGSALTITFAASITAKGAIAREYTLGAGSVVQAVGVTAASVDAGDPGSMNLTVENAEHLWVRGIAIEHRILTFTPTASFTGSQVAADTATTGSSIQTGFEFRIFTGTGNASDPTFNGGDNANGYVALREVAATTPTHGTPPARPGH